MYIYERKNNKAKVAVTIGMASMFLFVSALFIWNQNNEQVLPVNQPNSNPIERLQLPLVNYEEVIIQPYTVGATILIHFFAVGKDKQILEKAVVECDGVYRQ